MSTTPPPTLTSLLAMDPRARDAMVAERVFGFSWWLSSVTRRRAIFPAQKVPQWFQERAEGNEPFCSDHDLTVPRYSTDPAADYAVLEKVRTTWSPVQRQQFADALWELWQGRAGRGIESSLAVPTVYAPGDYALASLLAFDACNC